LALVTSDTDSADKGKKAKREGKKNAAFHSRPRSPMRVATYNSCPKHEEKKGKEEKRREVTAHLKFDVVVNINQRRQRGKLGEGKKKKC